MDLEASNDGVGGWYNGLLKRDAKGDHYRLQQLNSYAEIQDVDFAEEVWKDAHGTGLEVMMKGILEAEELLTGSTVLELGYVDRAGVIIEESFSGRKVGVAGYDLIFLDEDEDTVYRHDSQEELEEAIEGWFDDEEAEQYIEELDLLFELDGWPWNA